ncbi:MAG: transposase [Phycisphaera sp.]|nr:transposase [Phycisphaera sp.]
MAKRKFTRGFKESAVRLVRQQGYTVAQAAKSLGVDAGSIRGWLAKFGQGGEGLTPTGGGASGGGASGGGASGGDGALRAENQRLRRENARLLMEREILKKAAAFFAKEQP